MNSLSLNVSKWINYQRKQSLCLWGGMSRRQKTLHSHKHTIIIKHNRYFVNTIAIAASLLYCKLMTSVSSFKTI